MYQTLYRKYRPNNFDEVVGQKVIIKTLKNEVLFEQLNHAYLFTGPRGTGKTSIAKILAKVINCESNVNGEACNNCVNCTQIKNKQSTDIIEIDAASNNGVDEIRELKSKVNLVPSNGKYKIYIIDEVHMLTLGAFNALLKTLEEPPAHIIFILATTDPHKIPSTILSRCQRFDFKKISMKNLVKRLNQIVKLENINITETALLEIARLSDGGMRDALSMLDQVISYSNEKITVEDVHEINGTLSQEQLGEMIEYLFLHDLSKELNLIDDLNDNGKNLVKLTEELIQFLRNTLLYQVAPEYFLQQNSNVEVYKKISREIKQVDLLQMIKKFNQTLSEMHNSNNPKLLLELLIISTMNFSNIKEPIKIEEAEIETQVVKEKEQEEELIKNETQSIVKEEIRPDIEEPSIKGENNFNNIVKIRINNALAGFTKTEFLTIKRQLDQLKSLLIDPEYSKYISIIMDAELKATGNNYLIFVNKNQKLSDIFNYHIIEIEDMILKKLNNNYKVISIDLNKWDIVKKEFNSKMKKYNLEDEKYDLKKILNQQKEANKELVNKDEIQNLFSDIIEYEER